MYIWWYFPLLRFGHRDKQSVESRREEEEKKERNSTSIHRFIPYHRLNLFGRVYLFIFIIIGVGNTLFSLVSFSLWWWRYWHLFRFGFALNMNERLYFLSFLRLIRSIVSSYWSISRLHFEKRKKEGKNRRRTVNLVLWYSACQQYSVGVKQWPEIRSRFVDTEDDDVIKWMDRNKSIGPSVCYDKYQNNGIVMRGRVRDRQTSKTVIENEWAEKSNSNRKRVHLAKEILSERYSQCKH